MRERDNCIIHQSYLLIAADKHNITSSDLAIASSLLEVLHIMRYTNLVTYSLILLADRSSGRAYATVCVCRLYRMYCG